MFTFNNVAHSDFGVDEYSNVKKVHPKIMHYSSFINYAQDNIFCDTCRENGIEESCNSCLTDQNNFVNSCIYVDIESIKNYYIALNTQIQQLKINN